MYTLPTIFLQRFILTTPFLAVHEQAVAAHYCLVVAALQHNTFMNPLLLLSSIRTQVLRYLFEMTSSVAVETSLGAAVGCLSVMASFAQLSGIPYAAQVISLASEILTAIQRVRNNKVAFQRLAADIQDLVVAVRESTGNLSAEMEHGLERLVSALVEIYEFVLKHTSRGKLHRVVASVADASKINEYRAQIRQALDLFGLKAQIVIHQNLLQIIKELAQRGSNLPRQSSNPRRRHILNNQRSNSFQCPPPSAASSVELGQGRPDIRRPPSPAALVPIVLLSLPHSNPTRKLFQYLRRFYDQDR
ncbi:hypothetical protein K438DRAFT_100899 [Mycena galopus ATCC 62051]|nr:hypothetical protein K438DRAFT_100899 [Mycena galopus ATCC 62051]